MWRSASSTLSRSPPPGSRSILLWPPQHAVLDDHGVLDEALALGRLPEAFGYSTGPRRLARFRFTPGTGPLILPQHHTDRLLEKALIARGVHRTSTVATPWLGADGVRSTVGCHADRTRARTRFLLAEGSLAPAPAVTDIEYVLTSQEALLIAPLPDGSYRVAGNVDAATEPGPEEVRALLKRSRSDLSAGDLTVLTGSPRRSPSPTRTTRSAARARTSACRTPGTWRGGSPAPCTGPSAGPPPGTYCT
ncbi:hypothetical protein ABTX81_01465 [Kitasatospora sp. NPDC097605]|uniref:hypothetical protein n=1 Tax=Kitasatospora sp. NPDC097605 TaxID=3157226 RepID=UPI00331FFAC3